jgi:hypothetical protein
MRARAPSISNFMKRCKFHCSATFSLARMCLGKRHENSHGWRGEHFFVTNTFLFCECQHDALHFLNYPVFPLGAFAHERTCARQSFGTLTTGGSYSFFVIFWSGSCGCDVWTIKSDMASQRFSRWKLWYDRVSYYQVLLCVRLSISLLLSVFPEWKMRFLVVGKIDDWGTKFFCLLKHRKAQL